MPKYADETGANPNVFVWAGIEDDEFKDIRDIIEQCFGAYNAAVYVDDLCKWEVVTDRELPDNDKEDIRGIILRFYPLGKRQVEVSSELSIEFTLNY